MTCGGTVVHFVELGTQRELAALATKGPALKAVFRPDGKMLAVVVSNRVELWRWPERTLAGSLEQPAEPLTLVWHPDGRRLACACSGMTDILLWDSITGLQKFLRGHAELVPHLVFDHRGELLVSFSWDGSTRFWQASDGELLFVSRDL